MKAFPQSAKTMYGDENCEWGMDLRDYFAAKIIVALLPNNESPEMIPYVCKAAYSWANEMMEARNVTK